MPATGPEFPPSSIKKRRRNSDDDASDSDSSSDSDIGPAPPRPTDPAPKKAKVIGPSMPPSNAITKNAVESESEDESSDDDDFGPNLPPATTDKEAESATLPTSGLHGSPAPAPASKRDDWMMAPPSGADWTGRVDPTKIKSRKFNTGKGAKAPSSSSGSAADTWHETPQEKQARLQREIMGIKDTPTKPTSSAQPSAEKLDAETAKRLQEYNKHRGPSLYEAHQKGQSIDQDDDPSARAFDREKDIGGGLQINATQRRDMTKRASDFGSRFSSAKYL